MKGLGTLINLVTVAAGGVLGVAAGHRLPDSVRRTIMQGLGLVTIGAAVVGFEPHAHPDEGLKRAVIATVYGSVCRFERKRHRLVLNDRVLSRVLSLRRPSSVSGR